MGAVGIGGGGGGGGGESGVLSFEVGAEDGVVGCCLGWVYEGLEPFEASLWDLSHGGGCGEVGKMGR